jgi:hypothetical protein
VGIAILFRVDVSHGRDGMDFAEEVGAEVN